MALPELPHWWDEDVGMLSEAEKMILSDFSTIAPSEAGRRLHEAEMYLYLSAVERLDSRFGKEHWWSGNARLAFGRALIKFERFVEANAQLTASEVCLRNAKGLPPGPYEQCLMSLVELYDAWDKTEPGQGYDLKAAEWRAKLAEWQATTQPATTQP